jgi:hypothetical protein
MPVIEYLSEIPLSIQVSAGSRSPLSQSSPGTAVNRHSGDLKPTVSDVGLPHAVETSLGEGNVAAETQIMTRQPYSSALATMSGTADLPKAMLIRVARELSES